MEPKEKRTTKPDGTPLSEPPYKDVSGRYRTQSLFVETINRGDLDPEVYWPLFTLREHPVRLSPKDWYYPRHPNGTVPSIRQIYLAKADPAEYEFAMEVFKSDRHWKILVGCEFFKPYLEEWRTALAQKLRSEAVMVMRDLAVNGPGPQALQAAKWLAENDHFEKPRGKGRPSNAEVARETRVQVDADRMLREDAERMGLDILDKVSKLNG